MLLAVWLSLVAGPSDAAPDTIAGQVVDTARHGIAGVSGLDLDLVARQTRLSPFDVVTAGYGLLDLYGGVDRHLGSRPLRIELQVRNALDTGYRDFLSRYKAFALNPGRNVVVRLATEL